MSGSVLAAVAARVRPPDAARERDVRRHLDALTKPPGSLGRLEDLACRLALVLGDPPPPLVPRVLMLLAGDHGVARRGVSAYPAEVTGQMCRNIAAGGAAASVLGRVAGTRVLVADVGVAAPVAADGVVDVNVVRGTADLAEGPAMSLRDAERAVGAGVELFERHARDARVVCVGEMGIANTTTASALTVALTGCPVDAAVGRGTGLGPRRLARKRAVVARAAGRVPDGAGPLQVLAEVGGAEIGGMVGVILAAAAAGRPVVIDGFICGAAALLAVRSAPASAGYLLASHRSAEPGHGVLLDALALEPLLDLGLRLGEGTGAVLALPLLDAAAAILREMATFSGAGVSGPEAAG